MMQPTIEPSDIGRVNGFAKGDRVAIVGDGQYTGWIGRVFHSRDGCHKGRCRDNCKLVRVELTHRPALYAARKAGRPFDTIDDSDNVGDMLSGWGDLPPNSRVFRVKEVTHID